MDAEALYVHQLERIADAARRARAEAREGHNIAMISGDAFRALCAALDVVATQDLRR